MSRFEAAPHPLLRPFVEAYWGFVREAPAGYRFSVTPDCYPEAIVFADPPARADASGLEQLPACTLVPLLHEPLELVFPAGVTRCASVRLHAWAAGIALSRAGASNANGADVADGTALLGDALPRIVAALRREAWTEVVALLDCALLQTYGNVPAVPAGLSAVRALTEPRDAHGDSGTAAVAARQGSSRRQLERRVRALTDRSPKQLSSLRRFQFARDALWARPEAALDALALEAGYADQAHFTRQFRRYAGRTPAQFKRECLSLRTALAGEDVAFVQDRRLEPDVG